MYRLQKALTGTNKLWMVVKYILRWISKFSVRNISAFCWTSCFSLSYLWYWKAPLPSTGGMNLTGLSGRLGLFCAFQDFLIEYSRFWLSGPNLRFFYANGCALPLNVFSFPFLTTLCFFSYLFYLNLFFTADLSQSFEKSLASAQEIYVLILSSHS